jgi:hypothetical protein
VTINQAAGCSFTVSPTSANVAYGGGPGIVGVTVAAGCAWTATSNSTWITITGGASGTGNGTVDYSVAANSTSSARTGTLTVAGQTVTINEAVATQPAPPGNLRIRPPQ